MAGDWIKMRSGLRRHAKVIAMSRHLGGHAPFRKWLAQTCLPSHHAVTESVTDEFVTGVTQSHISRVTVCGLADVWSAINGVVKADGHAPFLTIQDLDDIAEIPGFGKAMEKVGWVTENDDGSLSFPNFTEHNTPEKERGNPKTDAERAAEYRARKKAEKLAEQEAQKPPISGRHERHVTSHREEKNREDIILPPNPHGGDGGNTQSGLDEEATIFPKNWRRLPKAERKRTKVLRNTPRMIQLGSLFGRMPGTLWYAHEAEALLGANPSEREVAGIVAYYSGEAENPDNILRRDLITLLNNWSGELDRARAFVRKNPHLMPPPIH